MKEVKINLQYLITIGAFVCTMAGFYYTTTYRLSELESKIKVLEENHEAIIRLEERLKNVQKKTDEIYNHILEFIGHDDH